MKTPTCIRSIKHLSTKSRDYHFPKRLKVAQWCSLQSRTSLSSVYFSWNTAQTTMWKKDRQWKAVKKGQPHHKISLTICRWSFIFSTKFFKLVLSDDFTRLGSSRRFFWPALSTSFKWQNWSKILKGEHYPKRHWDFSLNSFSPIFHLNMVLIPSYCCSCSRPTRREISKAVTKLTNKNIHTVCSEVVQHDAWKTNTSYI